MRIYRVQGPDGRIYRFEGPDDATPEQVTAAVAAQFGGQEEPPTPPPPGPQPQEGFMPSLKSSVSSLKADAAALAGRTGLMGLPEAEDYIAKQKAYQEKTYRPTEKGWTEAPLTKLGELAGGSLPYMVAPIVAGLAAPEALGIGALGLGASTVGAGLASATQFAGSGLSRQTDEGKKLGETNLGAAALAAIPQAALDVFGLKMVPGIGKMFEKAGIDISEKAARDIAKEGLAKTITDYTLTTGKTMGTEGLTEAAQQVFERLQAGLSITDPEAQKEYFDNFIGGAVLGGVISPAGRYFERGAEQARFNRQQQAEPAEVPAQTPVPTQPEMLALPAPVTQATPQPTREVRETPYTPPPAVEQPQPPTLRKAMEMHDLLNRQYEGLKTQYTTAAQNQDTATLNTLRPQLEQMQASMVKSNDYIESLGGTTKSLAELETAHQAALATVDKHIDTAGKKLVDATQNDKHADVAKYSAALDKLKTDRENLIQTYTKRSAAAQTFGDLSQRGQTRDMFTEKEAPVPKTPEAPKSKYLEDQGVKLTPEQKASIDAASAAQADLGPTSDDVKRKLAIQTAEHIGGQIDNLKREVTNMTSQGYLADNQGAPNLEVTNKFAQIQALQTQFDALTKQYSDAQPTMKPLGLFDPDNMLKTSVDNGDIDAINRLTQQRKQQNLLDRNQKREAEKAENDRLIKVLDERLGLGGDELTTKGQPLRSVKSTRISEGNEYDALVAQIQAIRDKVEKVQGNSKYSVRDRLDVIAAEHEEKKAIYNNPKSTSRQRAGALKRMNSLVKEFNGLVDSVLDPAIKNIQEIHAKFRKVEPAKKVSEVKAEKAALLKVEGKDIKMSPEARRAKRINEGNIAPEIEKNKAVKDIARDLGEQTTEYQDLLNEFRERYAALKERYGADDKSVQAFKKETAENLDKLRIKLGRATPEYKARLKELVSQLQESYASAGTQEIASKRTQQVTRRTNTAPRDFSGVLSRASKQELKQKQQSISQEFREATASENETYGMRPDIRGFMSNMERSREARGVEVESPDLTKEQVQHIDNNDIRAALNSVANDSSASPLNRAVAQRLAGILDNTDIFAIDNLKSAEGEELLGQAISTEVQLNRQKGMTQEVLLHEGTHAAVERVIVLFEKDPSLLTETQQVAMRELKALHEAVKKDPSITSANAKGSLSEFAAEVLSNRNLQEQLRSKKWKMSDAWQGVKSIILRLLGFSKAETETMLGAGIQAVDALMIPSSVRGVVKGKTVVAFDEHIEGVKDVPYSNAQKDIAALDSGSNSMKQFAEAFALDIKQKDRTPEDVERIANAYMGSVYDKPEQYIKLPTADTLDYTVRMSDGKQFDPDNPLHYVEATSVDFAMLQAQGDPKMRKQEAEAIADARLTDLNKLAKSLEASQDFTNVERALVLKAAIKHSVVSGDDGRLKLVNIDDSNRHNVAVVSAADAAFVIQKLREGLPLKKAFLEGLQENADRNADVNKALNKNGWQKFDQVPKNQDSQKAAEELNAACAGTPWCTGSSIKSYARGQIEDGDFYVYYKDGKPQVAVRMDGQNKIGEVRGNAPQQALTPEQQKIATTFLASKNFENSKDYLAEFKRKASLVNIAKGETNIVLDEFYINDILAKDFDTKEYKIDKGEYRFGKLFKFKAVDGYGGRPKPSDSVKTFFANKLNDVVTHQFEQNRFVGVDAYFEYGRGYTARVPLDILFNGKTYTIDPKTVKELGGLSVVSNLPDFPNLEKVGDLKFIGGNGYDFPTLKKVGNLIIGTADPITSRLAAGAEVGSIGAYGREEHSATIYGMETVGELNLSEGNSYLKLTAPDLLYAPKPEPVTFREHRLSRTVTKYLEGLNEPARKNPALVNQFYNKLPERFIKQIKKDIASEHPDLYSATLDDLVSTVMRSIENSDPTQTEIFAVHKTVNDFCKLNDYEKYAEIPGTLTAPKLIGDTPPAPRLTEAPEAPRYAKVGVVKDKEGNSFFRSRTEATSFGSSFIAKETSAKDKFLGNVMGITGRVQFVDRFAALSEALKQGVNDKVLGSLEAQNAEYFLRFGQNRSQLAGQALTNGNIRIRQGKGGGYIYESVKGPNMMDVATALEKGKFKNDTEAEAILTAYVAGLRADVVGWEKLNFENTAKVKQEHAEIMAMLRTNPEKMDAVKEAARIYKEYNDGLVDFVAQAGYITEKRAAELKKTPYIPFYRVNKANNNVELMIDKEHAIRIGNLKDEPQLHELIGDNKHIMPIFTSAVQNTFMLTDMALRNKSVQESAFLLHKMGMASVISQGVGPANSSTVRFHVKGVPHFVTIDKDKYGIPADLIVKGLEGIKTTLPAAVQMLGMPANLLRNFIVRNPAYAIRQVIRDPMTAWLTTGTDATPILASMRELATMVAGRNETENTLMSTGAISSNVFTGDQRDMSKFLKEISTGKSGWAKLMARADALALQGDAATRAVIYKDSLDKGMSEQAALLRTLESMNFNRRGLSPSIQWLNTMIPFFNAQIQGLDVLYRAFKGDMPYSEQLKIRQKLVARGMLLAAGTLAYAAMMQDDEAYKRAKPEERYGNWFVYVPGLDEPLKIPVPFELGYLFKSLPEAVFNVAASDEKAKTAVAGMMTLIDQSNPFQLPAAIKPVTEAYLGKSFFGGDIESAREKKMIASERSRDTTTEAAKLLGKATGAEWIHDLTGHEGLSAISIDHLIRGYTGGLGVALVQLANPLLNSELPAEVAKPSTPLSKQPFIGGLFQPVQGRGTLDAAYDQMLYIQQVKGTFDDMIAKGQKAEARAFMQEHMAEMSLTSISGSVQKQLGELAKQERMIKASPNLTTERKDELLKRLDQIKQKIARGSMAVYDKTKDRFDRS
jgi:hypothetical protein